MQEYSAQRFQVPPGLPELLKRWTKEVLRYQPDSIEDFSQKYFTALAEGTAAQFFETMEPANITFRRSEVEMEATDKPLEADVGDVGNDAEGAATKIQALHEKKTGKANLKEEEATVATAEEPVDIEDNEDTQKAAVKIQSVQRGRQARKEVQEKRAAASNKPSEDAAEEPVDIEDNEDTQKAAVKIQSVQRGRQARKEVQEKRAAASDKPSEDAAEVQVDAVAEAIEESEEARTEAVTVEGEAPATEEKPADAPAAEAAAAEGETAAAEGEAPAES
jgi:hypothetical protein